MISKKKKHPLLITIPHASTFVPEDLRKQMLLDDFHIQKQSDLYTDEIYNVENAHTIQAEISRLVADVNRAPDDVELAYQLYHDGVVIKVDEYGDQVYEKAPEMEDILQRVDKYHTPFHQKIESLAPEVKFLIDGHSYWSKGPDMKEDAGEERADISLGNRKFTTCSRDATYKIMTFFREKGFSVAVNDPYPGEYLIGYHCSRRGLPGLHVEINRKLYMNEKTLKPYPEKIQKFKGIIFELVEMIAQEIERNEAMGKQFI